MSVIGSNILAGASGQAGYNLTKSLRFRSSASASLSRTPASASNRTTWTWSGWVKRAEISDTERVFFSAGVDGNNFTALEWINSSLFLQNYTSGTQTITSTTAVFRDPSAWYHIVLAIDTTQATAANRAKIYVNGVQQAGFSGTPFSSSQQFWINFTYGHRIGARQLSSADAFSEQYMTEINFVDGQALTPSSFGETSTTTGVWIPKKYTGTYGTNGFYLPFTNTTSTSTLGNDFSGNSNTWTVNNISLTSGSTYDSMTDVPTLTSATTANYCVLNPLDKGSSANPSIQAGNLNIVGSDSSYDGVRSTIAITSGKWYWEAKIVATSGQTRTGGGIYKATDNLVGDYGNGTLVVFDYLGTIYISDESGGSSSVYYSTSGSISAGDVFGFAFDADTGKVYISKNGTYFNSGVPASGTGNVATLTTGISYFAGGWAFNSSDTTSFTFGQQPFTYTPPTGFVALNTFNLPTPTIGATASTTANKYFDAVTRNGFGSSGGSVTSLNFQPDFWWEKARNTASNHTLIDSIRGVTKELYSNLTNAESTGSNFLVSFNSNGFTMGSNDWGTSTTLVDWVWKANGSGSTNTAGSITSTVSANTTAGFSIVLWTGNGVTAATVGHGLGVVPAMIICKERSASGEYWHVKHQNTASNTNLFLNQALASTSAASVGDGVLSDLTSSTTFGFATAGSPGNVVAVNENGVTNVAYCFAQVAGYSAFGSYTGNGSTDGPFIFTGFRPRFVMIKRTDSGNNWFILDTARDTFNLANDQLLPNSSAAESTNTDCNIDMVSNGFKLRTALDASNGSGGTYIYYAVAENPFKYANAR